MPRWALWSAVGELLTFVGLIAACAVVLVECTPQQQQSALSYQQKIAFACGVAMGLAPVAGPYAPWIIGGCATEEAIAKLALDPNSLAWLDGLVAKVQQR